MSWTHFSVVCNGSSIIGCNLICFTAGMLSGLLTGIGTLITVFFSGSLIEFFHYSILEPLLLAERLLRRNPLALDETSLKNADKILTLRVENSKYMLYNPIMTAMKNSFGGYRPNGAASRKTKNIHRLYKDHCDLYGAF